MHQSRRNFLKTSALFVAGSSMLSNELFAAKSKNELLGVQLYSVRDDMKKDPLATLKALADMGYKNVEHANYINRKFYGYSATEFKKVLSDLGLSMPSGHTVMARNHWDESKKDFTDAWKYTVEDAATVGQQIVISPWLDESLRKDINDFKRYMEVFNKSGELCKKSGMRFGYHNHDFEFSTQLGGEKLFDLILQNTDPKLVVQQLDIGNMYGAGGRALDIMKKYPGRFESMHVKDEIKSEKGEMGGYESTVLGKGVIPVKEIVDLGRKSGGTTQFIIEQESYQGMAPLDTVKEDFKIMKSWGY
ncbi:TIM barrel protein [Danxiaibacter flavus]|uniref:TIM barrel protein n=1 Tax=Danxiaibacter flavus TaxID=3049108 RepID=A0ABV3Z9N3_9BACT|nr:TIM barrel protein [Chitinophagaceae bacterium DXS]